ncbi:MAG TPA: tRNA pseudouridine(55) synthase TruB [Pirellulales bacterium]|nr:tRNA pseudouridine(55) synthase TruB [Pirellulales bacterium]
MTLTGLLNLHKPPGMTSREAVDRVKRWVRPAKTGHAGTLDPLASGVLVVAVGSATRLIEYVQAMPKSYVGTFLLGRESSTEDIEGEVRTLADAPTPSVTQLREAAARLTGEIEQRPPAFSALKVQGRRAYDLARAGLSVELAPRPVTIHRLDVLRYEYPEVVLDVECSSGTYIRSLGRDLAAAVGTAAVMSALVRTAIGSFRLDDATHPDELDQHLVRERLLAPRKAVAALPIAQLTDEQLRRVRNGLPIAHPIYSEATFDQTAEVAGIDADGQLAAILAPRPDGQLWPVKNLG